MKKQKAIYVHPEVFSLLVQARGQFEAITGAKFTWSAFLFALASGGLSLGSLAGMHLRCPECGAISELRYSRKE